MTCHSFSPVSCFVFTLFITLSACSPTGTIAQDEQQSVAFEPERPLPYPIELPMDYRYAIETDTRTETGEPGSSYWQNYASYELQALLLPDENRVEGTAKIQYQNNSPYDLRQLILELTQNLHQAGTMKKENTEITGGIQLGDVRVRDILVPEMAGDGQSYQSRMGYIVDSTRMLIALDEPLESGDTIDLEISWSFNVPQQGAGGRMGRDRGNLFFIAYWYPQISVYDDVIGWFTDPFLGNAEFYHGFADYEIEITAPDNWLVMGTGDLLNADEVLADHTYERYIEAGESDDIVHIVTAGDLGVATQLSDNGTLTWRFLAENVRDVAFSATRESLWDGTRAPVRTAEGETEYTRIHSFYRQDAPLWEDQAEYAQHSTTFLSEFLNHPYPWPHMTSVEGAGIIGGGMEYPMITIMGSYNNVGAQGLHGVTAHEIAHMWIPMIVSTNERRYTWMDEGFTTYNTHHAMVDRYPRNNSNTDLFQSYLNLAGSDLEGPIMRWSDYHYPGPAYGIASYPKPASVTKALKGVLGEDLFTEAYHTFIDEWAYKHPYPWDFFHTVERVTGMDLDWFWRSWYYETWTLDQAIGDVEDHGEIVTIRIHDLGDIPMPVHLLVLLEDGSEITATIPVDSWLEGRRETSVTLETGSPVYDVVIDPDNYFPDVDRSNNYWRQ